MQDVLLAAVVKFERVGFHRWPDAPDHRDYLVTRHRHKFYFEVSVELLDCNREIEFHDLLDFCKENAPCDNFEGEGKSCEALAVALATELRKHYPGRSQSVSVFEDNEVGAVYSYARD